MNTNLPTSIELVGTPRDGSTVRFVDPTNQSVAWSDDHEARIRTLEDQVQSLNAQLQALKEGSK